MAIGLVNDTDFASELERVTTKQVHIPHVINGSIESIDRPGRAKGDVNVPASLRTIIGETGNLDSRRDAVELAASFGLSPASASAYANGATSTATYDKPNSRIANQIQRSRNRIARKARSLVYDAMEEITPDKLQVTNAKDLSGIAKDLSAVVKNIEGDGPPPIDGSKPAIIIFAPQIRPLESFDIINVRE